MNVHLWGKRKNTLNRALESYSGGDEPFPEVVLDGSECLGSDSSTRFAESGT